MVKDGGILAWEGQDELFPCQVDVWYKQADPGLPLLANGHTSVTDQYPLTIIQQAFAAHVPLTDLHTMKQ